MKVQTKRKVGTYKCKDCKFCNPITDAYLSNEEHKPTLGTCKYEKAKVVLGYRCCFMFQPKLR